MSQLRKISVKILTLIVDISLLAINLGKQLTLPNRKGTGNLLSSLFLFFIGIIERLNFFEHGIFCMAALFGKKYVKQALLIIGFVLFLLSLFEWTADQGLFNNTVTAGTEQLLSGAEQKIVVAKQEEIVSTSNKTSTRYQLPAYNTAYYTSFDY